MANEFGKAWLVKNSKEVLSTYSDGITLRQLYYRLVARGMPNNLNQYKNLVAAMTGARWDGEVEMSAFVDRERSVYGETRAAHMDVAAEIDRAKDNIKAWMTAYYLNKWSNQDYFVEVWIEKKALQGVFESPCDINDVALSPCKGYPSLTFLHEARERFDAAIEDGKEVVILYFGDYDPSGEDIPRSVQDNLERMGCTVKVDRRALHPAQIKALSLPSVPPKKSDSRTAAWNGKGVVELDAVEPRLLTKMCTQAIADYFDDDKYEELKVVQADERKRYQAELKEFVDNIGDEE